ncbi:putative ribonuclease H-like domain-containing protein [Tanacetum coccineum]
MVPRTVLTRFGPILVNAIRPVNIVQSRTTVNNAGPMKNVINNAYSTARRPFNKITAANNSNFTKKVNTVKGTRVNTARPQAVLSVVKGNKGNVETDPILQIMKKLMADLLPFEVTLKEGKLLGKNSVLFTDIECVVLSPYFKLTDESYVLLKVPRKDNMYSVDLKNVIPQGGIENLIDLRVKVIRCDNGTEFKNRVMNQFYKMKGIKREFSVARTPQQNGVVERKNKTLIEVARTMLADSKLPTTFWAEVVNTACYVKNRVLVIKPHNNTHYELFLGRKTALGCLVTIHNTIDHLGKFDGKAYEGFFVGYTTNSKAFRVFNSRTRIVEENMHVQFSENTTTIIGSRPDWLFDIDALTKSMNYKPVVAGNQSNGNLGTKACNDAGEARMETIPGKDYILLPMWPADPLLSQTSKSSPDAGFKPSREEEKKDAEDPGNESGNPTEGKDSEVPSIEEPRINQEKEDNINNTNNSNTASDGNCTNNVNAVSSTVNVVVIEVNVVDLKTSIELPNDPNMPELEDIVYSDDDEDVGAEANISNLDAFMPVKEPKKVIHALKDPSWIESMQDELLNKKDERGIVIKNKARLVEQGYTQEEGINYDEVFAHGARNEAIRLILAYASSKDFVVYQMDVKSAFLYGKIEEEVYVYQPPRFEDPDFPDIVYKVEKVLYGLHQAPRACFIDVKTTCTPTETHKPLLKDADGEDVDEHVYRSMIGSQMYLTSSRPDIMFVVCACERYQVNPKVSHLHVVKWIFRYLKGQPKLDLQYPKDSPFDLVAYTNSDYARASLDRKSTIGGCQFLGCRLILWQCKKETMVANSKTKAEYIAASNCYGHSTICIVKNPVFHSKTKHIEIRHHFIRDFNENKLIQMIKIHTDQNVVDLLTKAFDVSRFQYLIASTGMLNL